MAKDLGIDVVTAASGGGGVELLSKLERGNETTELTVAVLAGLGMRDTEWPFPFVEDGYTVLEDSVGEKVE